ncbi:MAG: MFS transporter [Candidatus Lokiarchaeota archaeon]|nr:MFS transporter [Candidatus Lokiarchaeota archaeon]MBD3340303.1 MFS transporter [Candidatus Lokiarchaeota archaeon]
MSKNQNNSQSDACLDDSGYKYPSKVYTSFSFGYFVRSFLFTVFAARVFAFYENEVRLDVTLVLIAYVLYGFWNMINDPLIGYFSDKPNRFWNKWGRRFPWIVATGIPYCFLIIIVFTPPNLDATTHSMFIFGWLLFSICLYDAVYSGWMTNYYALFPDKFRSDKERRKIAGIGSPLGLLATALGTLLPPLFITYGDKQSYVIAMIVMAFISFGAFLLSLPGSKETKEMIDCAHVYAEENKKQDSFFKSMKIALKHKNFLAYLLAYLAFHSLITIMMASIPYIVPYILGLPASSEVYIAAALLVGQLLGVILWAKLVGKVGHRNLFLIGLFWAVIFLIPLIFFQGLMMLVILIGILGFGLGSIYLGNQLVFSDCIDEIVIDTQKRQEGIFLGIRTFMVRLSIIIQAFTFWAIHLTTGFNPGIENQPDLAIWGLRIQFALIPLILMLIAGLLFGLLYDLKPEKVELNKKKLLELNL